MQGEGVRLTSRIPWRHGRAAGCGCSSRESQGTSETAPCHQGHRSEDGFPTPLLPTVTGRGAITDDKGEQWDTTDPTWMSAFLSYSLRSSGNGVLPGSFLCVQAQRSNLRHPPPWGGSFPRGHQALLIDLLGMKRAWKKDFCEKRPFWDLDACFPILYISIVVWKGQPEVS